MTLYIIADPLKRRTTRRYPPHNSCVTHRFHAEQGSGFTEHAYSSQPTVSASNTLTLSSR
jgi:hypothetical protein